MKTTGWDDVNWMFYIAIAIPPFVASIYGAIVSVDGFLSKQYFNSVLLLAPSVIGLGVVYQLTRKALELKRNGQKK
jgi:hypothetical protein